MQRNQQSTDRTAESTMNQSQETMERLIALQRNMAEMTLSALELGESAQRQGIELTQSMLESAPGPRFTESMMERYLEGMEAIVPEMEQVMERGMRAAAQPGMAEREQRMGNAPPQSSGQRGTADQRPMGRESGQSAVGGRQQSSQHSMGGRGQSMREQRQPTGGQQQTDRSSMGGQQQSSQQPMGDQWQSSQQPTNQQSVGGQGPSTRQSAGNQRGSMRGGHAQSQGFQQRTAPGERYPQTGQWVTPREYGGESTGTADYQQQSLSAAPNPSPEYGSREFEGRPQRGEAESRRAPQSGSPTGSQGGHQQGREQPGGPTGGDDRSRGPREGHRPTEGGGSGPGPGQTEQGRLRDQYAQRIDPDRSGADRVDAGRGESDDRDDRDRSPERPAMEEPDATPEQPEEPTDEPTEEEE